jgi:hypothetical protein
VVAITASTLSSCASMAFTFKTAAVRLLDRRDEPERPARRRRDEPALPEAFNAPVMYESDRFPPDVSVMNDEAGCALGGRPDVAMLGAADIFRKRRSELSGTANKESSAGTCCMTLSSSEC